MIIVRENQLLLEDVDIVDELHIDDKSLANAHEYLGIVADLGCNRTLHVPKVHIDFGPQLIDHNDICIVAVGLEVDNLRDLYPLQFVARIKEYVHRRRFCQLCANDFP